MPRRLIGVWLMADGLWTAIWFTAYVNSLSGRDMVSVTAMIGRSIVGAMSIVAGWSVSQRRPAAPLGITAALLVGAFGVLEAATRVLPTNLDPAFRWPVAWVQVLAAILAIVVLRREGRERM
jgi:hypothetical protein